MDRSAAGGSAGSGFAGGSSAGGGTAAGGSSAAGGAGAPLGDSGLSDARGGAAGGGTSDGSTAADGGIADAPADVRLRYPDASASDDYHKYLGRYLVTVNGGTLCDGTSGPVSASAVPLEVTLGTDSNLIATTNPLPGQFPTNCGLKMNPEGGETSGLAVTVPSTSCTAGGASIEFGGMSEGHVYTLSFLETGELNLSVNGVFKNGGSNCTFAYSGTAQPIE